MDAYTESVGGVVLDSPFRESSARLAVWMSRLMKIKIGIMPLPAFAIIACIVFGASLVEIKKGSGLVSALPADMLGGFAVIMVMGWLLGEIGSRIPLFKDIGGPAILSMWSWSRSRTTTAKSS